MADHLLVGLIFFNILMKIQSVLSSPGNHTGRHWFVGWANAPPFATKAPNNSVSGYTIQIFQYIADKHGLTIDYVELFSYGSLENGTWNGIVGHLVNGDIDVGTSIFASIPRILAIDFSVPIMPNNDAIIAFLCPFPEVKANGNSIAGIFKPFQFEVWICIGISLIICSLVLRFVVQWGKFSNESYQASRNFMELFWFLIRIFLNAHDGISTNFKLPGKIVAGVWCLTAVVLVNAFSGCVTSFIMSPILIPMVDSIGDIAALAPRPILMVNKFTATEAQLMDPTTEIGIKIGGTLHKHPENRLQQTRNVFNEIPEKINSNGGRCYAETESILNLLMEYDVKKTGTCRLYVARNKLRNGMTHISLPKHSPIAQFINKEINWLRQVGLLDYWRLRFFARETKCSNPMDGKQIESDDIKPFKINQLMGCFVLLGIGFALSIFCFLCELVINQFSLKSKK